jgi:hypothetical protein
MYPYQIVFTNNATTRLAASISNTATTATLSVGTGQFFPSITAGQAFTLTLSDSPTGLTREIVLVTARNGDQITMIRGQEGTNAIAWIAGTYVENRPTAKFLNSFDNLDPFYAIGGGTSDAITAELVSPLLSFADGFYVIVRALSANTTTTPTFQITLGTTAQPVYTIVKGNNQPLAIGDISGSGFPIELIFSANFNAWIMMNPQTQTPAGSNTQIQYNNNGSFAGSPNLTFDGNKLGVNGTAGANCLMVAGSPIGTFSANSWFVQNEGSSLNRMYYCGPNNSTYGSLTEYSACSNGSPVKTRYTDNNLHIFYINDAEAARIDNFGRVQVGGTTGVAVTNTFLTGSTIAGLNFYDDAAGSTAYACINFLRNNSVVGSVSTTNVGTNYTTTSDYRLKNVIAPVTNSGERIDALEPIEYDWKFGGRTRGFLAHQFAEVYPSSVSGEKDAVDDEGKPVYQAMQAATSEVMADLIAEIQSLRKRVEQLESK